MSERPFRLAIGQIPSVRGDVPHNLGLIERHVEQAKAAGADLVVFPELALTGYLVDSRFAETATKLDGSTMTRLRELSRDVDMAVGLIEETPRHLFYNSAVHLARGKIQHLHRKIYLPTYGMFDERRFFGAGWEVGAYDTRYIRMAMLICGDAWHLALPYLAAHAGADLLVVMAASSREGLVETTPAEEAWRSMCSSYALTLSCFVAFANLADSNDPAYTFWGGSFVAGPEGKLLIESETTGEDQVICDLDPQQLRRQRIKLPFRRDDSLAHTLDLGKRILIDKVRRDRFRSEPDLDSPAVPKPR